MSKPGDILLVEDNEGLRTMLRLFLEQQGYALRVAVDGQDALELMAERPAEVILTDIKMPRIDGMELLRRVKDTSPDTEVILMTAYAEVDTAVEAVRMGAYDYIIKPIHNLERDIGENVAHALARRRDRIGAIELLKRLQEREKELESDMQLSGIIQQSLLPDPDLKIDGIKYHAVRVAPRQLSGDFYDIFPIGQKRVGLAVGHAFAREYSASLLVATLAGSFRRFSREVTAPEKVLQQVNKAMYRFLKKGQRNFISLFYGVLDLHLCQIHFAVAGKPKALLLRSGTHTAKMISEEGPFLGQYTDSTFPSGQKPVQMGDMLMFTTGETLMIENAAGSTYGPNRLFKIVIDQWRHALPVIGQHVLDDIIQFGGESVHSKELTFLLVKFLGRASGRIKAVQDNG